MDPIYPEMSAIWKFLVTNRYLSYDIIKELQQTKEMQSLTRKEGARLVKSQVFPNYFVNGPLFRKDQLIGHVFVVGYNSAITPGQIAIAEQIRLFTEDLLQKDARFTLANIRGYENFLLHLLTGTLADPAVIKRQCQALSWRDSGDFLVAVFQSGESDPIREEGLCRKIEQQHGGRPVLYEGCIAALYELDDRKKMIPLAHSLHSFAFEEDCPGGLSDIFHDISDIKTYFEQAQFASMLYPYFTHSRFMTYQEAAIWQLLQWGHKELPSYFMDPVIPELAAYDNEHNTDYFTTLCRFLENERNITDTSEELGIHRNTLLYRMSRILKMFPRNLDNPNERMRILLSMLLYLKGQPGGISGS